MFANLTRSERVYLLMYLNNAQVDVWNAYFGDLQKELVTEFQDLTDDDSLTAGMGIDD